MFRWAVGLAICLLSASCSLVFEEAEQGLPDGVRPELRFDFQPNEDNQMVSTGTLDMTLILVGEAVAQGDGLDLRSVSAQAFGRAIATGTASEFVDACQESNEFSLSVWFTPLSATPIAGLPSRIISLEDKSSDTTNFMLGQGSNFDPIFDALTVRTGEPNDGEFIELLEVGLDVETPRWVGFSMDATGNYRMWAAGSQEEKAGRMTIDSWDPKYTFSFGDTLQGDRQWKGILHHVDLFCTFLSEGELRALSLATRPPT